MRTKPVYRLENDPFVVNIDYLDERSAVVSGRLMLGTVLGCRKRMVSVADERKQRRTVYLPRARDKRVDRRAERVRRIDELALDASAAADELRVVQRAHNTAFCGFHHQTVGVVDEQHYMRQFYIYRLAYGDARRYALGYSALGRAYSRGIAVGIVVAIELDRRDKPLARPAVSRVTCDEYRALYGRKPVAHSARRGPYGFEPRTRVAQKTLGQYQLECGTARHGLFQLEPIFGTRRKLVAGDHCEIADVAVGDEYLVGKIDDGSFHSHHRPAASAQITIEVPSASSFQPML